jgi:hypothetical protein
MSAKEERGGHLALDERRRTCTRNVVVRQVPRALLSWVG